MREIKVEDILEDLSVQFWTRLNELVDDIEDMGYRVEDSCGEYIAISGEDEDDDRYYMLYLGHANNTMWIERATEVRI